MGPEISESAHYLKGQWPHSSFTGEVRPFSMRRRSTVNRNKSIVSRDNDEQKPADIGDVFKALGVSIEKLSRDLKKAGANLDKDEARFLVDAYYSTQEDRIRYAHQVRQLIKQGKPNELLLHFAGQSALLEAQIQGTLDVYSMSDSISKWMRSITGIGPVIASGFRAYLDLKTNKGEPIHYVGQWWRFAGLDPSVEWKKGQKRPWCTPLKTLCYKVGESFVKVQNRDTDFYGKLFAERKQREWEKNLKGENRETAIKKSKAVKKTTSAYQWYSGNVDPEWARQYLDAGKSFPQSKYPKTKNGQPMLSPAHIHGRARRWVVKLFLSHLFEVWYVHQHGELPEEPFVLTMDGHNRKIEAPGYRDFL